MKVLSLDPGGTTGFCTATDWAIDNVGEWSPSQLKVNLRDLVPQCNLVICEDYIINTKKHDHHMDKGDTLRYIGMIEYACWVNSVELVLQPNWIKPAASGFSGRKIPYVKGKKGTHTQDALLHFVYYACQHKKIQLGTMIPMAKLADQSQKSVDSEPKKASKNPVQLW